MDSGRREYQKTFYNRHFPKRVAAVRSQLAHPLFRSFNDRVAETILDAGTSERTRSLGTVCVFEPGCGEGLVGSALERVAADRGIAVVYTGADLSQAALDLASSAVSGDLRVGDAFDVTNSLPVRSQDVVVAKNLLHHLDDPAAFLRAATRVLTPGGRVVAFEPRLTCPQFLIFNVLAARRERYFFRGQRRNAAAFEAAGYRVVERRLFGWLPYELAFVIRPEVFRKTFSTSDPGILRWVSRLDDRLSRALPWFACYAVWVATPGNGGADD